MGQICIVHGEMSSTYKIVVKIPLQKTEGACIDGRITLKWISGNTESGKVKLTPEQAMKAQRGSRGIALLLL